MLDMQKRHDSKYIPQAAQRQRSTQVHDESSSPHPGHERCSYPTSCIRISSHPGCSNHHATSGWSKEAIRRCRRNGKPTVHVRRREKSGGRICAMRSCRDRHREGLHGTGVTGSCCGGELRRRLELGVCLRSTSCECECEHST
ncbi:hypothetical protein K439DRAFT_942008 [Ramaria rubella]|nr:hypothetical protein K439DRAFT_942008 [Ramaria rubella]